MLPSPSRNSIKKVTFWLHMARITSSRYGASKTNRFYCAALILKKLLKAHRRQNHNRNPTRCFWNWMNREDNFMRPHRGLQVKAYMIMVHAYSIHGRFNFSWTE